MGETLRPCWRNCYAEDDARWQDDGELALIDGMEDALAPMDDETAHIRWLITCHESCHHKAARHVELIIEAIGSGRTEKGPGTRPPGSKHPVEDLWQNSCDILSAWCAGSAVDAVDRDVGGVAASELTSFVRDPTPLKIWQVQRVVEKVQTYINPETRWGHIEVVAPRAGGPDGEFVELTKRTVIHDTVDGEPAQMTLAYGIDFLKPCNWNFVQNLVIVLKAIGGEPCAERPFAHCDRNIKLVPIRDRMRVVSDALAAFCEGGGGGKEVGVDVLGVLGPPTPAKHWLAASLSKTLRVQLGF